MKRLLERTFPVATTPEAAWTTVADASAWPTWAGHLRRVDLTPTGLVTPTTEAKLTLSNRTTATVAVTEFDPGRHFRWEGRFLWLALGYDHTIEPTEDGTARITFAVDGDGFGVSTLGRLFAAIYARNLDRAIPRLQAQLEAAPAPPPLERQIGTEHPSAG